MSTKALLISALALAFASVTGAQQHAPDLEELMRAAPRTLPHSSRATGKPKDTLVSKVSGDLRDELEAVGGSHGKAVDLKEMIPVAVSGRNAADAQHLETLLLNGGATSVHRDGVVLRAHVSRGLASNLSHAPEVSYITIQSDMALDGQAENMGSGRFFGPRVANSGYTGVGVKVGIIDFGFAKYARLEQAGLLPEPAAVRGFGLEEGKSIENGEPHGTACAEVLHSVAPGATLYLAVTDGTPGAWQDAANCMRTEQVDIVNFSGSWAAAELDGSDPLSRMLDEQSRQDGRLWVVSAGNAGKLHWLVPAAKADKGGWIRGMSRLGGDTLLAMQPGEIGDQSARIGTGKPLMTDALRVLVSWDDWSANHGNRSGQDLDACLYVIPSPGEKPREVKCSSERQSENPSVPPEEEIRLTGPGLRGQVFYLGIHATHMTRPLRLHIFVSPDTARLANSLPGSVLSPATARMALAIGALDVTTSLLADYSAQGPTDDGRVKPDLIGPAGSYVEVFQGAFRGTSASSSFVAGLAAVRASMPDHLRGQLLGATLRQMAAPFGSPVPNNLYGNGLVSMASLELLPSTDTARPAEIIRQTPALVSGVPISWGGPIPVQLLEAVRARPASFWTGGSKIVTGRDLYQVGDGLKLGLQVDHDSAYLLFYRSKNGEYLFLEPSAESVTSLPGGRGVPFPRGDDFLKLDASWVGEGEFIFITAPQPVDWRAWQKPHTLSNLTQARMSVILKQ